MGGKTVYVVDDDAAVRDSLERLFKSVDIDVRTFESGEEFLDACPDDALGCLVVDLRMPGMSAFDIQSEVKARMVNLQVIIITGYGDVETGVRAMKEGAFDFIEKPFNDQSLLEKVQHAIETSQQSQEALERIRMLRRDFDTLTSRETDVLQHILAGEPNKQIAFELDLSEKTIEFHRANVMKKTHSRSLASLVHKALLVQRSLV